MSLNLNLTVLGQQYAGGWNDKNGTAAYFTSEDSDYRTYQPSWVANSDGTYTATMAQDHIRGEATDDHVDTTAVFDSTGNLSSAVFNWYLGGNDQIPDAVITVATDSIKVAGIVADVVATLALSPEAIPEIEASATEFADTLQDICNAYNKLSNFILKKTDDGGRMNFIAVSCHNLNKLCGSVGVTQEAISKVSFSTSAFATSMGVPWNNGSVIKSPNCMEYGEKVPQGEICNYRTWIQDVSAMPPNEAQVNTGLLVSTKIDHIRGGVDSDDHAIVLVAFDSQGTLVMGQASVQLSGQDSIITDPITMQSGAVGGSIIQGVQDAISSQMKSSYGINGSTDGRHYLPTVINNNMFHMTVAVTVAP